MPTPSKSGFNGVIAELAQFYKSVAQAELTHWANKRALANLFKHTESVRRVKTIWQMERAVDLLTFYCPSKVSLGDVTQVANNVDDILNDENLLIEGVAGQGKSILLRYLCSIELGRGKYLPLFFELRRIEAGDTLMGHIRKGFESLGLEMNEEVFQVLAQSGKLLLMLDGFDEVNANVQSKLVSDLETLSERFPSLRIIVTSRPASDLHTSAHFAVAKLAALKGEDYVAVVDKLLANDTPLRQALLKSIKLHKNKIESLLTTPLLVTLLVLTYRSYRELPTQLSEFYDALFVLLLQRHDNLKTTYRRTRACKISNHEYRLLFEAFCFQSKKCSGQIFSHDQLIEFVERAATETKISVVPEDFVADIQKITCLILREGNECRFIHRSVQEFYAAAFLKRKPEPIAARFYQSPFIAIDYIGGGNGWEGELRFLEEIDSYRFAKFFILPTIAKIAGKDVDALTEQELSDSLVNRLGAQNVAFTKEHGGRWVATEFGVPRLGYFVPAFLNGLQSTLTYKFSGSAVFAYCENQASDQSGSFKRVQTTLEDACALGLTGGPIRKLADAIAAKIWERLQQAKATIAAAETNTFDEILVGRVSRAEDVRS